MNTTSTDTSKVETQTLKLALAGVITLGLGACGDGGTPADTQTDVPPPSGAASVKPATTLVQYSPDYPKPMFIGTPVKVDLPHLEAPGTAEISISVEEGTTLISKNKTVTSSDTEIPIQGELSYITDGDKDGGDGYYVELSPDLQWVQIDLGDTHNIQAIGLWHFHKQARAYNDIIVQISDDAEFKSNVKTVYNNDHDNSAGLGKGSDKAYIETNHGRLISGQNSAGRYIRLYSAGNTSDDLNHYVEVEIYGKPNA